MPLPFAARRSAAAALALAALVVLPACDSGGPEPIGITGRWEGTLTNRQDPSKVFDIELRLTDDGRVVVGSGDVDVPNDPIPFSIVEGSFVQGQVFLPLRFNRPPFQGTISGRLSQTDPAEITGTFDGPNLANGEMVVELRAR